MAYTAIPRKYRPQKFSEVTGQEFITETLKNAIKSGRFAHAYIFAGPRGVGKTTTARIVAKALNCENPSEGEPCNACPHCIEIAKGSHPDVIEIDAATNRGIDQIRELRESVHYSPAKGKRKVYIIDEFHMLTREAFNALLKTLEEPPNHVVFILATTEIDKIPPTILSRCQKFIFRKIPQEQIVETLSQICKKEGVEFEREALELIAVASEGCMRDAESLLDQSIALGEGKVTAGLVSEFLGVLTGRDLRELLELGFEGEKEKLKEKLSNLEGSGYNPVFISKQLLNFVEKEFLRASNFSEEEMIAAFKLLSKGYEDLVKHPYPYTVLLFSLYSLSYFREVKKLEEILRSGVKPELPRGTEKKTENYDPVKTYAERIEESEEEVRIYPKNETCYKVLSKRLKQLQERFGKRVSLEIPKFEERVVGRKSISSDSDKVINKLVELFNAKVIQIKPKVNDESSDS